MEKTIRKCSKCGFILGTRPNLKDKDNVCSACINDEKKKSIDFKSRQEWLTQYIADNKTNEQYDCLVAVSGGKDSTTIVRRLFENHGVKKALLVNITDEFTKTKAGISNLNNIVVKFKCDLITFRICPEELKEHIIEDFTKYLNPLKWIEQRIYQIPLEVAKMYNIKLVFYGENPEFEYGSNETLEIFHEASTEDTKMIFLGAIYPYSIKDWTKSAREVGFIDLDENNEWQRHGQIENATQIDSMGYIMQAWTKFVKFGFQRVTDMASRFVREGMLTYDQAQLLIKENDYICDPAAKRDFCRTIGITEKQFDDTVDKHANKDLVVKDINGVWKRRDLL